MFTYFSTHRMLHRGKNPHHANLLIVIFLYIISKSIYILIPFYYSSTDNQLLISNPSLLYCHFPKLVRYHYTQFVQKWHYRQIQGWKSWKLDNSSKNFLCEFFTARRRDEWGQFRSEWFITSSGERTVAVRHATCRHVSLVTSYSKEKTNVEFLTWGLCKALQI